MKKIKKFYLIIGTVCFAFVAMASIVNSFIISTTSDYIVEPDDVKEMEADCILVLGAGLKPDGTPNYMLQDRLDEGVSLYLQGAAPKILLSGDHGQKEYDEVNGMKEYVLAKGVPAEDVFLDHAGFSTYESMYRAKGVFDAKTVIVITQKYHQYRALYNARNLGLNAYGVISEPRIYAGQSIREIREVLARNKDFVKGLFKPAPTYLGDVIPISGSGVKSHD